MSEEKPMELTEEELNSTSGGRFIPEPKVYSADGHEKGEDWYSGTNHLYRVKSGDSLAKIGQAFGFHWWQIRMANPQIKNPNLIYVGDVIRLPNP